MLNATQNRVNEKMIREEIGRHLREMESLVEIQAERELNDKEENRYKELERKVDNLQKVMETNQRMTRQRLLNNPHVQTANDYLVPDSDPFSGDDSKSHPGDDSIQIWKSLSGADKGRELKAFGLSHRLSDEISAGNDPEFRWSDYLRARIQGYSAKSPALRNFMSTTADSAMVPTPLSAQVIDLARNKSKIFQAGAMVIPMDSKTLTIARVTGDPAAEWKAENASHTPGQVTTEPLTFTSKTLVSSVKMSVELSEDAPNADQVISNSIAQKLALVLDQMALVGSGQNEEPQGIFGADGVQTEEMSAALDSYDPFSLAYQKVLQANGQPTGIIYAPRTWGALDRLKDENNQPLSPPQSYNDLPKFATNQVPINLGTGENESLAFVGDWQHLLIGIRTDLRLEVSRFASDEENSAFEDLQVWIRGYLRADVQLAQPTQFCVITQIT